MRYAFLYLFSSILFNSSAFLQNNPCIDNEAFHLVILGSSTAAGSGASQSDSAWVNRYRNHLQSINPENEVTNLAVGGFNTYRIMPTGFVFPSNRPAPDTSRNITTAINLSPDGIIVNLPSNDVSSGYSVAEQLANFDTIVNQAMIADIPIWICTTQPKNYGGNPVPIQKQLDVRDSILAKYSPRVLDFWTGLADSTNQIDGSFDSGDGTHLNDRGHALLFDRAKAANLPLHLFEQQSALPDYSLVSASFIEPPACGQEAAAFQLIWYNRGAPDVDSLQLTLSFLDSAAQGVVQTVTFEGLNTCEFDTLLLLLPVSQQGLYEIDATLLSNTDNWMANNRIRYVMEVPGIPTVQTLDNFGCEASSVLLEAIAASGDSIRWWDASTGGNIVGGGPLLETPWSDQNATYYAESVRGLFYYTNELSASETFNIDWNGVMFDLLASEPLVIDSLAMVVADTGWQTIEIYQKTGTHLGNETNPGVWEWQGSASVYVSDTIGLTTIAVPFLAIPAGDTTGIYMQMANANARLSYQGVGSAVTVISDQLTLVAGSGANHDFGGNYYPRYWAGKIFYHYGEKPNGDCTSERVGATATIQQLFVALPADTILDVSDTIILDAGDDFMLYDWSNGETTQVIQLAGMDYGTGIYPIAVTVTDSLGCSATDNMIVVFAPLVSAIEQVEDLGVHLFPNPAKEQLFLSCGPGEWQIFLSDMNGVQRMKKSFTHQRVGQYAMDVVDLLPGVYLLQAIKNGQEAQTIRLILQ